MTQDLSSDVDSFADRLRKIRDRRGVTTKELADITEISKRTLESYMLQSNPSQPGLDALKKLSTGLGISLDWLVFGPDQHGFDLRRTVRLSCRAAILHHLSAVGVSTRSGDRFRFADGGNFDPAIEEFAAEISMDASERAERPAELGIDRVALGIAEKVVQKYSESIDSKN